jgi:hypothetical protein
MFSPSKHRALAAAELCLTSVMDAHNSPAHFKCPLSANSKSAHDISGLLGLVSRHYVLFTLTFAITWDYCRVHTIPSTGSGSLQHPKAA